MARAEAVRAFGVVFAPAVAVLATEAAASAVTLAHLARGRRPPVWALAGVAATALHATVLRPWIRDWGATAAERTGPLPGDGIVPEPAVQGTRAVGIAAPPERVWPWLAQIGQDRGGFYSMEWAENLAGCRMRNADRVHPEWQHREVGETVPLHPATGLRVTLFSPPEAIALEGWGAMVVRPDGRGGSRLLVRNRRPRGVLPALYATLLQVPHFVMERAMLRGIRRRAEAAERGGGDGDRT